MNISSNHHHHRSSTSDHRSSSGGGRGSQTTTEQIQHRVMKSVSEYNRQLNQERKDDRRVCMDLQTYTIQYPVGLGRENIGLRRWIRRRRRISPLWRNTRRYPVALIPNQYQDWFLQYSPQELKYLPLNTVIHGPINNDFDKLSLLSPNNTNKSTNNQQQQQPNGNNSDSDIDDLSDVLSDWDDDSTCSCGEVHCSPATNQDQTDKQTNINDNNNVNNNDENAPPTSSFIIDDNSSLSQPTNLFPINSNNSSTTIGEKSSDLLTSSSSGSFCKICKKNIENIQEALCCADCGATSHPACLEISGELLAAIRLYRWQCQDCKSCNQCGHPHDEEKMMFCDKCDRGYHTYCVGLEHIPQGHWVCSLCAVCADCGTLNPIGKDVTNNEQQNNGSQTWQHELIKLHLPDGQTMIRHVVLCNSCYQLRKL